MRQSIIILFVTVFFILCSHTAMSLPYGVKATAMAFSPDGKILAISSSIGFYLYDTSSFTELKAFEINIRINSLSFSRDGAWLVGGCEDNTVKIWNMRTREWFTTLKGHLDGVTTVSFNPEGSLIGSGSDDGTIKLWDAVNLQEVATLRGHSGSVYSVSFSPDGSLLASGGADSTVKLWDVKNRRELATFKGHSGSVYSVSFNSGGSLIASGSEDRMVKLWDVRARRELATLQGHSGAVYSVSFNPDGSLLASGSNDYTVKLWNVKDRVESSTLMGFSDWVTSVSFNPGGVLIACGCINGTARIWRLSTGTAFVALPWQVLADLTGFSGSISSVSFSPDNSMVASGSVDNSIRIWDTKTRNQLSSLIGHEGSISSLSFSPDGSLLASGSNDSMVKLWNVKAFQESATLQGHSLAVRSVAFNSTGTMLASGGDDKLVRLWDVKARQEIIALRGHPGYILSVSFSPDGSLLASGSIDSTIKLWDVKTRREIITLSGHQGSVYSVSFSPDGSLLASGSGDGTVKLWDVKTRQLVATLSGHSGYVTSVAFNPDGYFLASGSCDNTVKIWNVRDRREAATLTGNPSWVTAVSFNPDGSLLASGNDDATITLRETAPFINYPPTANPQSVITKEDSPVNIALTGSDPDRDRLTFRIASQPSNGTLSGTPPNLTYTPGLDFNGIDRFTFTVNDGAIESNPAIVSITVESVNDLPAADPQSITTDEDKPIAIRLTGSDPEKDRITFRIIEQTKNGTLSGVPPDVTYTPNQDFNGNDSFTFAGSDGTAEGVPATIKITVMPVNDLPTADSQSVITNEDSPVAIVLGYRDIDQDRLTVRIVTQPKNGSLSGTAPNLTYTPKQDFNGADSFTFIVNDGTADSRQGTVSITVKAVNDPPIANSSSIITNEDTPANITLIGRDPDGDPITFRIDSQPKNGALSGIAPNLTYTPKQEFNGIDSFTFIVNDGTADSKPGTVSISVKAVNDPPAADSLSIITNEDTAVNIVLTGKDIDGDKLTFKVISQPSSGSLSGSSPNLTYTPKQDFNGADNFTYTVNDGAIESEPAKMSISVNPVNDPPTAAPQTVTTDEDIPLTIKLSGNDPDNDKLSYKIINQPGNGALSGVAPDLTYTPKLNFNGTDSFTFAVSDGIVESKAATVNIKVNPVNDPPTAAPLAAATEKNKTAIIKLAGSDPDGDKLTFKIIQQPKNGALSGIPPDLIYTPVTNFAGVDSFTYTVSDGAAESKPETVNITVKFINAPPIGNSQSITTNEDSPINITLTGEDPDKDKLAFKILDQPKNGTLSGTPPGVTYTPKLDFYGADSFTFTVSDGIAESDLAKVSITVSPVNDPPVGVPQTMETNEDTPVSIKLTGKDMEGDKLSFRIALQSVNGTISGTPPDVTYTPKLDFSGADSFTFIVSDGTIDGKPVTISITVKPVNDPPIADSQSITINEDVRATIKLTGKDVDGDKLTFKIVTQPKNGTLSGTPPEVTYTPKQDFNGTDSFTFTTSDGTLESKPATISIIVNPINDPPTGITQSVAVDENVPVQIKLSGSDPDGDKISFRITVQPKNGTLSGTPPDMTYIPKSNFAGADSFTFIVNDGTADGNPAIVSITVMPINYPPAGTPQTFSASANAPVIIKLSGSDPDSDKITFKIVQQPKNGTLTGSPPDVTYTPATDFSGTDSFSFIINDGLADSEITVITINIKSEVKLGTLTGTVMDTSTGKPVPGVTIQIDGDTLQTDTGGKYQFSQIKPGDYTVIVSSDKYIKQERKVTVKPDETAILNFELNLIDGILVGVITDADTNKPVPGVSIIINAGMEIKTDSRGEFKVSLQPGKYELSASKNGYIIEGKQVEISPNKTVEFSLSAQQALEVWPGDTNNDGRISIRDVLPIGRYWNKKGSIRSPKDTAWKAGLTPKASWNPKEAAYADADGNGAVDEKDVLVIAQNWRKETSGGKPAPEYDVLLNDENMLDKYRKMYQVLAKATESDGVIALKDALRKLIISLKPQKSLLLANYPNPFNPNTWIPFILAEDGAVAIRIYDVSGKLVRELKPGWLEAGYYVEKDKAAYWDGRNEKGEYVTSGVYMYMLNSVGRQIVRKMVILD